MKITDNKPYSVHLRLTKKQFENLLEISSKNNLSFSDNIRLIIDKFFVEGVAYANNENNIEHIL